MQVFVWLELELVPEAEALRRSHSQQDNVVPVSDSTPAVDKEVVDAAALELVSSGCIVYDNRQLGVLHRNNFTLISFHLQSSRFQYFSPKSMDFGSSKNINGLIGEFV